MSIRTLITVMAAMALVALASAVVADIGLCDIGEKGQAVIHVGDVTLRCTPGGNGDSTCSMPADGAGWSISEKAGKLQFIVHYHFINQRPVMTQRFVLGYTVWRQDGQTWTIVADKANAVAKTVAANSTINGDCSIPTQKLGKSGGTFKITLKYEGCDAKSAPQTRILTVDRVL